MSSLKIKRDVYELLKAWGLSREEFYAVLGKKNGVIAAAEQVPNRAISKRNSVEWLAHERNRSVQLLRKRGFLLAGEAHSHPRKSDKAVPSEIDHFYGEPGQLEIVVKATTSEITAWIYGRTYQSTLNSRVDLEVIG